MYGERECHPPLFEMSEPRKGQAHDFDQNISLPVGKMIFSRDFPGGPVVKNPPSNAGDAGALVREVRSHMPRGN